MIAFMLLCMGLCSIAQASVYWLDDQLDPASPHYRTAAEACYLGVFAPQIRSYRHTETNPNVRFRVAVMIVGPDQGLGERVCRGDIEKTYAGYWATTALIDTLVYGPNGSNDACNLPDYTDPDTGQCGPPKCTDSCCSANCGNGSNPIQTANGNKH
ncbi:MAG: hypothetical protein L0H70_03985 [Xanthomonadales bacterium]|nr:hypothetical protein [Xanthomonadales bacterium]